MPHDESLNQTRQRWMVRLILAALLQQIKEDLEVSPLILADACGEEFVNTYLEHGTVEGARRAAQDLFRGMDAWPSDTE